MQEEAQVEILESLEVFPSTLPTRRESAYAAWVSVSVGCNNTCTFCIVPSLRGKEKDRRPGDILAEIRALVDEGVSEVTLLGQNVNAYGVEFGDRQAFSKLLRACGDVDGLERVRFTSPHPAEFTDDVIEAMAQTPNVMHQLHMPLQSGSDRVLRAMRRSYRRERYLGIIERVRAAMPDAALSTDIIVGFPGETEDDFAQTLEVVREARFAAAFTFQYSIRPGTPAATMPDQVPAEVVRERYGRLVELVDEIAWAENSRLVGPAGRAARRRGRGPQGRRHPPAHRSRPRQPPGPLHGGRRGSGPVTSWRSRSPTPPRTTSSPTGPPWPTGVPAPETPGRPAPPAAAGAPRTVGARHAPSSAHAVLVRRLGAQSLRGSFEG